MDQPLLDQPRQIDVAEIIDSSRVSLFQIRAVALCALIALFAGYDAQAIGLVTPVFASAWNLKPAVFGPVFTAGLAGMMAGAMLLSPVADAVGRKRIVLLATALFGGFTLATIFAARMEDLLLLRFATGVGIGGALAAIIALTAEFAPRRRSATLVTLVFLGFPLGSMIAGLIGAPMVARVGWPSVLLLGGIGPLILLPILAVAFPESVRHLVATQKSRRWIVPILAAIRPDLLWRKRDHYSVPEPPPSLPVVPLLLRKRAVGTLLLWIIFFATLLISYFVLSWLPAVVGQAGLESSWTTRLGLVFNGMGIVGGVVLGILADRHRPYGILAATFLGAAVSVALLGFVATAAIPLVLVVAAAGFFAVGAQFAINALAARLYTTTLRATGIGWGLGMGRLGVMLGPTLAGIMTSHHWGLTEASLAGAALALLAAAAMMILAHTGLARQA